ncbi:MAG TPA: efflux RND transporter periplasmic adaptor subunit [Rhizobiaceae bacterium]|nr:efflux RND transporter periplasmic adaptor subunit [Rhizobiaceae bacterium]
MRVWKIIIGAAVLAGAVSAVGIYVFDRNGWELHEETAGAATRSQAAFVMPVPVAKLVKKTIPIYLDYPARTEAIRNVTLEAKVSGYIEKQVAPDGADVKKGDLLYKIDPRDYQALLDQANAQAERDAAALDYARSNLNRGSQLEKSGWIDKDSFDQRTSTQRQAAAALAVDKAAVRQASINLGYTEIRAPFDGRLGRTQAPEGTLVSVAGTALNTLVQLDPIYVTFNPGESDLPRIEKARAAGKLEAVVTVPGETGAEYKGTLTFLDNVVDHATGTITARVTVENPKKTLLPGQYVQVRLHIGDQPDALMAPQVALGSSQLGKYLYVVGKDNKVEQRFVSLGPTDGELIAVKGDLPKDTQVIVGNLQKIGPGSPVAPMPQKPKG